MSFLRGTPRLISGGLLLALALPGSGGAAVPDPGLLHVELRASEPAAGATLERAPTEVRLHFTDIVQASMSRIEVTGPDGRGVDVGPAEHPDPDATDRLRASLPEGLAPGRYDVDWRTAAADGHVVQGTFGFEIEGVEAPPDERPADREPIVPGQDLIPEGTGTRWLQFLGMILFLGVVASRYGVLPLVKRHEDLHDLALRLRKSYWRAGWFAVVLLLLALPALLYVEFWGAGPVWTRSEIMERLLRTAWGAGWFLHLGVVVLGGLGLVLAGQRGEHPRGWVILGIAALLLPLAATLQAHAWGVEELRPVALVAQYLHILGVGIWLGGLILLILVGLAAVRADRKHRVQLEGEEPPASEPATPPLFRLVNAFSRMALPAVALFVIAGVALSWIHTGGAPENIVGTQYGRTLLLKLALVAGALALGFYNWRRVRPGLAEKPDVGSLRIPASVEAVLAILVLLVTAVLVATPLP